MALSLFSSLILPFYFALPLPFKVACFGLLGFGWFSAVNVHEVEQVMEANEVEMMEAGKAADRAGR